MALAVLMGTHNDSLSDRLDTAHDYAWEMKP